MKTLIIGFIVFFGWSSLATHIYVCDIKGLCGETVTRQINVADQKVVIAVDTSTKGVVHEPAVMPANLVTYFAFDKSDFNSDAGADKYVDESITFLNKNLQARFSITGYTDAIGSDEYNKALGYRRAQRMQKYFESMGIPKNKINIESKGEKDPVDDNSTSAGRAKNRRTVTSIKN